MVLMEIRTASDDASWNISEDDGIMEIFMAFADDGLNIDIGNTDGT